MPNATVTDVANYFRVQLGITEGASLTHLKLQKLVYYAQAWSLVFLGRPLFNGEFEAWAHGPVNRNLYGIYRDQGWQSIEPLYELDMSRAPSDVFSRDELDVLDQVWEIYGDYDAKYLERVTHQERPWIEARGDTLPGGYCDTVISQKTMSEFYSRLLEDVEEYQS